MNAHCGFDRGPRTCGVCWNVFQYEGKALRLCNIPPHHSTIGQTGCASQKPCPGQLHPQPTHAQLSVGSHVNGCRLCAQKMSLACHQKTDQIEWRQSWVTDVPVVLGNGGTGSEHLYSVTLSLLCLSFSFSSVISVSLPHFSPVHRDLSNNQISEIAPDAFQGLRSLNSLWVCVACQNVCVEFNRKTLNHVEPRSAFWE